MPKHVSYSQQQAGCLTLDTGPPRHDRLRREFTGGLCPDRLHRAGESGHDLSSSGQKRLRVREIVRVEGSVNAMDRGSSIRRSQIGQIIRLN